MSAPKGPAAAKAKGPAARGAKAAAGSAKPAANSKLSVLEQLKANPKQALGVAVALLVLVQGGVFAWQSYQNATPALSAEETYESRLSTVQRGVQAYKALNKKLPADAAAVTAFLKSQGVSPPTTADGKRYEPTAAGRPVAPAL